MEWIFASVVLYFVIVHRTFRRVVLSLAVVAALGMGGILYYATRPLPTTPVTGRDWNTELFSPTRRRPPCPRRNHPPQRHRTQRPMPSASARLKPSTPSRP